MVDKSPMEPLWNQSNPTPACTSDAFTHKSRYETIQVRHLIKAPLQTITIKSTLNEVNSVGAGGGRLLET